MTPPCVRCHALAPLQAVGALALCATCAAVGLAPPCGDFAHDYHGTAHGCWVCLACGHALESEREPVRGTTFGLTASAY